MRATLSPVRAQATALLIALPLAATCGHERGELTDLLNNTACGETVTLDHDVVEDVLVYQECPADQRIRLLGVGDRRPLITGATEHALRFSGAGYVFEHLEFTSPAGCDLEHRVVFGNGRDMDFVDVVIRDGGFDGFGTYCDELGRAQNIRILDSEILRNGLGCFDDERGILNGDGVDLYGCLDCEIAGSYIHGNNNYQVQIKGGARGVEVRDSVIDSRSQYGLLLGKPGGADTCDEPNAADVRVHHNVIRMRDLNGWPLWIYETVDLLIEHNTVTIEDIAQGPLNPDGVSGGFVLVGNDLTGPFGATVRNNVFVNASVPLFAPISKGSGDSLPLDLSGLDVHHNLFFDRDDPLSAPPDGAASSLVADPAFVDFPADLGLTASSPAIDAGADLGAPFAGAGPDLGAFEFGVDGTTPAAPDDPPPGARATGEQGCAVVCGPTRRPWALVLLALSLLRRRRRDAPRRVESAGAGFPR